MNTGTSIVAHECVSYNAKIVQGNGWAEGLELSAGRNPLYVSGRRGRVRRSGVSADYRKRFRSRGLLLDCLRRERRKGEHKGKRRKSGVRRYRCGCLLQARLDYRLKKREESRKRAARRSKTMMRRKAKELWAISGGELYMVTLTYRDNMQDYDRARRDIRNFFRRLNWRIGRTANYIAVPERQQRGAWHWHLLIDVHMDWKDWERVWRHGFIWVCKVRNLKHAVRYVCKYVSKTFEIGGVPMGQHRYLCSKGLSAWTVEYVAVEEEFGTWLYYRECNEGYRLVGIFSCKEKGFRWWEAVSEETEGTLDIKDEFVRSCCDGNSMVVECGVENGR